MALSFDGVHWTRFEGDHHSGALFDVGQQVRVLNRLCVLYYGVLFFGVLATCSAYTRVYTLCAHATLHYCVHTHECENGAYVCV